MPRRSLRPSLNQIRAWVRQGRTDAWVAHQLEVSVRDIEQFKRQNDLVEEDAAEGAPAARRPRTASARVSLRRRQRGTAGGNLRPRRGGLRPVARPGDSGQPDL